MAAAVSASGAGPGPGAEPPAGPARAPEEELPPLDPAEVRRRLEHSERQFRNRRKLLIRGLPPDVSNQDVHELLKDYELKYCFVDKYKGTAFVTLQDAAQAGAALAQLRGRSLRGRRLRPQLQPAEAVLCVANLPRLLGQQRFEELLRPFGSLERCFLVYSPASGHSKGYGFVEYMKRDSAARARAALQGRRLGSRALYVHWAEASQLRPELLHSRCLCVDRLPPGLGDAQGLRDMAAATCEPEFCQLAVGLDGRPRGFAVLQFPSPEAAERVQAAMDGAPLAGSHVRVSFCAPGPPGRSMLAALTAAQGTAPGRGLLPEPDVLQVLGSLGRNPAWLQLLLSPLLRGVLPGAAPALLQLLLPQPQKPGILGDSPLTSVPLAAPPPPGKHLGEIPAGPAPLGDAAPAKPQIPAPFLPRAGPGGDTRNSGGRRGESGAVSLLGEPPKDLRIPLNPFLNLQSLLPTARPAAGKGFGVTGGVLGPPPEFPQDLGSRIFPPGRDPPGPLLGFGHHKVSPPGPARAPLSPPGPPLLPGSPGSYFSSGLRAGLTQSHLGKGVSLLSSESSPALAPPASHLKSPLGPHKRGSSHLLPSPEPSPEGPYVGQHSQGLGGHYADSYLKRKRIF